MRKKYNTPHRSRVVKTRLSEDESVLSFSCVRHTTHSFYHECQNCAIDAYTKKHSEFSERVCIDTQQKRSAGMRSLHPSDAERKGFGHSPTSILNLIFRNRIQKSCRGTTAHCLRVL